MTACLVPVPNITRALSCKPHMIAYDKRMLPRRLHYSNNHRIADVQLMMEETWLVSR